MWCQTLLLTLLSVIAAPIFLSWWCRGWYAMVDSDPFWFEDIPDMTGQVVVITGFNTATGYVAAREMAKKGADVIVSYSVWNDDHVALSSDSSSIGDDSGGDGLISEKRGIKRYMMKLEEELDEEKRKLSKKMNIFSEAYKRARNEVIPEQRRVGKVRYRQVNMDNLEDVQKFAFELNERGVRKIDILMLNDEIKMVPFNVSEDLFESHFAYNYLGHFLLVKILEDKLVRNNTRVVSITNSAHKISYPNGIKWSSIGKIQDNTADRDKFRKGYNTVMAYGQSKLANIILSNKLHRIFKERNSWATSNAVYPGMIYTPNHFPFTDDDVAKKKKEVLEEKLEREKITVNITVQHFDKKGRTIYEEVVDSKIKTQDEVEIERKKRKQTTLDVSYKAVDKSFNFGKYTVTKVWSFLKLMFELPSEGFMSFFYVAMMDAEIGAITQIRVAVDPKFSETSGNYFAPIAKTEDPSEFAYNETLQDELWSFSSEKTKEYWLIKNEQKKKFDYSHLWSENSENGQVAGGGGEALKKLCKFVDYSFCNKLAYRLDADLSGKLGYHEFERFLEKINVNKANEGIDEIEVREYLKADFFKETDDTIVDYFIDFLREIHFDLQKKKPSERAIDPSMHNRFKAKPTNTELIRRRDNKESALSYDDSPSLEVRLQPFFDVMQEKAGDIWNNIPRGFDFIPNIDLGQQNELFYEWWALMLQSNTTIDIAETTFCPNSDSSSANDLFIRSSHRTSSCFHIDDTLLKRFDYDQDKSLSTKEMKALIVILDNNDDNKIDGNEVVDYFIEFDDLGIDYDEVSPEVNYVVVKLEKLLDQLGKDRDQVDESKALVIAHSDWKVNCESGNAQCDEGALIIKNGLEYFDKDKNGHISRFELSNMQQLVDGNDDEDVTPNELYKTLKAFNGPYSKKNLQVLKLGKILYSGESNRLGIDVSELPPQFYDRDGNGRYANDEIGSLLVPLDGNHDEFHTPHEVSLALAFSKHDDGSKYRQLKDVLLKLHIRAMSKDDYDEDLSNIESLKSTHPLTVFQTKVLQSIDTSKNGEYGFGLISRDEMNIAVDAFDQDFDQKWTDRELNTFISSKIISLDPEFARDNEYLLSKALLIYGPLMDYDLNNLSSPFRREFVQDFDLNNDGIICENENQILRLTVDNNNDGFISPEEMTVNS